MAPCRHRRTKNNANGGARTAVPCMEVPEQRYHARKSVQLLIRQVIRRFDHGVLLIIRSQSDGRGLELLLITRGAELRRVFCSVATRYPTRPVNNHLHAGTYTRRHVHTQARTHAGTYIFTQCRARRGEKGGLRSLLRLGNRDVQLLDGRAPGERAAPSYREVVMLTYAANYLIPRHGLPRRV